MSAAWGCSMTLRARGDARESRQHQIVLPVSEASPGAFTPQLQKLLFLFAAGAPGVLIPPPVVLQCPLTSGCDPMLAVLLGALLGWLHQCLDLTACPTCLCSAGGSCWQASIN